MRLTPNTKGLKQRLCQMCTKLTIQLINANLRRIRFIQEALWQD